MEPARRHRRNELAVTLVLIGTCVAAGFVGCDREDEPASRDYEGKRLTVSGNVYRLDGPRQFRLRGVAWPWEGEVFVFARSPVVFVGGDLQRGDKVIATGTVHRFVLPQIERRLGWSLPLRTRIKLRDKPILIAQAITRVRQSERWIESRPSAPPTR